MSLGSLWCFLTHALCGFCFVQTLWHHSDGTTSIVWARFCSAVAWGHIFSRAWLNGPISACVVEPSQLWKWIQAYTLGTYTYHHSRQWTLQLLSTSISTVAIATLCMRQLHCIVFKVIQKKCTLSSSCMTALSGCSYCIPIVSFLEQENMTKYGWSTLHPSTLIPTHHSVDHGQRGTISNVIDNDPLTTSPKCVSECRCTCVWWWRDSNHHQHHCLSEIGPYCPQSPERCGLGLWY